MKNFTIRVRRLTVARILKKARSVLESRGIVRTQPYQAARWWQRPSISGALVYAGCGPLPLSETDRQVLGRPDEWVLVDKFVRDPAIRNWDAQTLAEFPDTGIAVLYSSHMLEHISHRQVPEVLAAWREKLASGGVVWLCVPDLLWMAEEIVRIANGSKPDGGHYSDIDGPYGMVLALYGSQHHDGEYHKSGFTKQSLEKLFKDAGYSRVEVKRDFDSAHDCGALFVQAIK